MPARCSRSLGQVFGYGDLIALDAERALHDLGGAITVLAVDCMVGDVCTSRVMTSTGRTTEGLNCSRQAAIARESASPHNAVSDIETLSGSKMKADAPNVEFARCFLG